MKGFSSLTITKHFSYLKWRNPHLYKLYVRLYVSYKGKPTPKISLIRFSTSILGTWTCLWDKVSPATNLHIQTPTPIIFTWRGVWEAIQRQVIFAASCQPANGSGQNRSWGPTANGRIFFLNMFLLFGLCTWYSLVSQQFVWWFHRIPLTPGSFFLRFANKGVRFLFLLTCSFGILFWTYLKSYLKSRRLSLPALVSVEDWSQKNWCDFVPKGATFFGCSKCYQGCRKNGG